MSRPSDPGFVRPLLEFARNEATSGMLLVATAVVAVLWANLAPAGAYEAFWNRPGVLSLGGVGLTMTLRGWINDLLMAGFFLLMGLEIKREFLLGELSGRARATLPVAAALGGMIVPAFVYFVVNARGGDLRGTGIPMATDIAFSLGVLALLGDRVPAGVKILLAAIAIVDDLGAVLVIALFYGHGFHAGMFAGALACLGVLATMNRAGIMRLSPYLGVGLVLWGFVHASGVHATVAGVMLAMTVPVRVSASARDFATTVERELAVFRSESDPDVSNTMTERRQHAVREIERASERIQMPLERLEDLLSPWITFLVMPVFALANAGVTVSGVAPLVSPVGLGVLLGLMLGKPVGVLLFSGLALRFFGATLPEEVGRRDMAGLALLTGIGFTMSLFIAELAFGAGPAHEAAKLGTIAASVAMGLGGFLYLRRRGAA